MKNWFKIYGTIFLDFCFFNGRSPRIEFWNFVINTILFELVLFFLVGAWSWFFHIAAIVAFFALAIRRFHDIGLNGWFLIGIFIPVINLFLFAMLLFFKSEPETNRYGSQPSGIKN